ncbi:MAG: DUF2812 domain-containing protein [Oscillospiraceae bacterium]|nr:DUF2812 domain-containing protein [Oscillospiraceae bacterium]
MNTYRFLIYDSWEPQTIEAWLEKQAEKGLLLTGKFGRFLKFEKTEPFSARYRLDPSPTQAEAESPDPERVELYEAAGWHYMLSLFGYHVYMTRDRAATELYTDPALHERVYRRMKRKNLIGLAFISLMILVFAFVLWRSLWKDGEPLLALLSAGSPQLLYVLVALMLLELISIGQNLAFVRFLRRLRRGNEPKQEEPRRAGRILRVGTFLLFLVLIGTLPISRTLRKGMARTDYVNYTAPLPLSLAEIEGDGFSYQSDRFQYRDLDYDTRNYVDETSDRLLAPRIVQLKQYGTNDSYLYLEFYRMKHEKLAKEVLRELEGRLSRQKNYYESIQGSFISPDGTDGRYYVSVQKEYDLFKAQDLTGDFVTVLPEDAYQHLYLQRGCFALHICYRGSRDLREQLPRLEDWLEGQ